jgi:hypothetical protein
MKLIKVNCLGKRTIAMAVFPFIFVNKNKLDKFGETAFRHELIHHRQQKEMLLIFFYVWYVLEYAFRIIQYKFYIDEAYMNISFEREAYANERDKYYLKKRKFWNWVKYLRK